MTNTARDLAAQLTRWADEPCCSVALALENPDCLWHGYRSVSYAVAGLLPLVRTVETRAMAHALTFFRDSALKEAKEEALQVGGNAQLVVEYLEEKISHLITQLGGEVH